MKMHPWVRKAVAVLSIGLVATAMTQQPNIAFANSFSEKTVSIDGRILSKPYALVASDGSQDTTYMPIWYVGQALAAAGISASWNGDTHTWSLSTGLKTDFANLPVGTGSSAITVNGATVKRINTYAEKDPAAGKDAQATVYMPIYYVQQVLSAAGIQATWNGQTWSIATSSATPETAPGSKPIVLGFVTNYGGNTTSLSDYEAHSGLLNEMCTFTDAITRNGALSGTVNQTAATYAASSGQPDYVSVTDTDGATGNFDPSTATAVLTNATTESSLVSNLVNLVKGTSLTGINIDFEMLPASDQAAFTQFLGDLHSQLHAVGKKLNVDVPAVTNANSAYNYANIGTNTDNVILMAYDYSYPGSTAGPIAPIGWVKNVLNYAVKEIPASKVILGIPAYGYDWVGTQTTALTLSKIDTLVSTNNVTPGWDATDDVPYFQYTVNGTEHTVYYENATSIRDELALVAQDQIGGVAIWRIGLENNDFWQAFANTTL